MGAEARVTFLVGHGRIGELSPAAPTGELRRATLTGELSRTPTPELEAKMVTGGRTQPDEGDRRQ